MGRTRLFDVCPADYTLLNAKGSFLFRVDDLEGRICFGRFLDNSKTEEQDTFHASIKRNGEWVNTSSN